MSKHEDEEDGRMAEGIKKMGRCRKGLQTRAGLCIHTDQREDLCIHAIMILRICEKASSRA